MGKKTAKKPEAKQTEKPMIAKPVKLPMIAKPVKLFAVEPSGNVHTDSETLDSALGKLQVGQTVHVRRIS